LQDLFLATDGSYWQWRSNYTRHGIPWVFNETANPCADRWQGLTCLEDTQGINHIYEVNLNVYNLNGFIPDSIGNLTSVQNVFLDNNELNGTVPDSVGNWIKLAAFTAQSNNFNGTIPLSLGFCTNLVELNLAGNFLTGTIPDSLSQLQELVYFSLGFNSLNGTIPSWIGGFDLLFLGLQYNQLVGTIPFSLGNMSNCQVFALYDNNLVGSIPNSVCNMQVLQLFYMDNNFLTGPVPSCIGDLTYLIEFTASNNLLGGPISAGFGRMVFLTNLYLYENELTGHIPDTIGNCSSMIYLDLGNNMLSGPIPNSLGNLSSLSFFKVESNLLTGTLPASLIALDALDFVAVFSNFLTGSIEGRVGVTVSSMEMQKNFFSGPFPPGFENCPLMSIVELNNNCFTGTVPAFVGELPYLGYINLVQNLFTGLLPEQYVEQNYLEFAFFDHNYLSGTIPKELGNVPYLLEFYLEYNYFSGQIPQQLGNLYYLQFLVLNSNFLDGSIPSALQDLANLWVLEVNNNQLSGPLDNVFNPAGQPLLYALSLFSNQFTGTLPKQLFELINLQSVSLVSNCMSGTLSESICLATQLNSISLDGLSSSSSCRHLLWSGVSNSYLLTRTLSGTIPSCVFAMPHLSSLHLSGNGLSGTLPSVFTAPDLQDLSLSHNKLSGTIPSQIQEKTWHILDLSFNRFNGELLSNFSGSLTVHGSHKSASGSLSLENNRLSGIIPDSFKHWAPDISVLGSNLFFCDLKHTQLPQHDSGRKTYQCASNSFDTPYYAWVIALGICIVMFIASSKARESLWYHDNLPILHRASINCFMWVQAMHGKLQAAVSPKQLNSFETFSTKTTMFRRVVMLCDALLFGAVLVGLFTLVILAPMYAVLKQHYGTQTHNYGWVLSAAFLTGSTATGSMFAVLLVLMCTVIFLFYRVYEVRRKQVLQTALQRLGVLGTYIATHPWVPFTWRTFCIYTLFILTNAIVVGGVNAAYVYVAIYGSSSVLFISQLALSCFKLFWNRFFSIYLIRWTTEVFKSRKLKDQTSTSNRDSVFGAPETGAGEFASLQVLVALLNNIAIPTLIVAVVSPSCFYNVFIPPPDIETKFAFRTCGLVRDNVCVEYRVTNVEITYSPPFAYSYQCSSSIITYYGPAFVILCIVRTFLAPAVQMGMFGLYADATEGTWWKRVLLPLVPPVLRPFAVSPQSSSEGNGRDVEVVPDSAFNVYQPYFDANQLILSMITYCGILMTFGVMFPPVAVAVVATMVSVLYSAKLKTGCFICAALAANRLDLLRVLEEESKQAGFFAVVERALWMVITTSCLFCTLFLFDTLGDSVGFSGAYWLLIVMPLLPLGLYLSYLVVSVISRRQFCGMLASNPINLENSSTHWEDVGRINDSSSASNSVVSVVNELHASNRSLASVTGNSPSPSIDRESTVEMMDARSFSASYM
jgi:Leucine-rich repeat (LRR) protein